MQSLQRMIPPMLAMGLAAASGCATATGVPWSTKSESTGQALGPPPAAPAPWVASPDAATRPEAVHELDPYARSLEILQSASLSEYDQLRANAIEALQYAPEYLEAPVARGLADENRGVRFVAAMTVGTKQMTQLAHLLRPLLQDESQSVQAAALFGLERCGQPMDLTPLAKMIASDDPEVRGNTAMILGELGNATALPLLERSMGRGMDRVVEARVRLVELQVAEAMVRLGDNDSIEGIRAALFTPAEQGEITALACMMCGRLRDERTVPNLTRLARHTGEFQQPAEVRMAAAWALAKIDPRQAPIQVPLEYVADERFQLRAQAAHTLGQIGDPATLGALAAMLDDQSSIVRVAVAGAIIQIKQPAGRHLGG